MLQQENLPVPKGAKPVFQAAIKLGVIRLGETLFQYLRYAIENYGWECIPIGGKKGDGKSNLLLQCGYSIYNDWDAVHQNIVTEPEEFLNLLDDSFHKRIPWIGWDDITVHLPRSLYFTDRALWAELQKNWAAYRTKMNCFMCTAPRKDRIASFVLEDITGDIICFNRIKDIKSHYNFNRWMWQRDFKDPKNMRATPLQVEDIAFPLIPGAVNIDKELRGKIKVGGQVYDGIDFYEAVGLTGVPRAEFKQYWERRLKLADIAVKNAKKAIQKNKEKNQDEPPPPMSEVSQAASNLAKKRWHGTE
jgi:hypothetical protein